MKKMKRILALIMAAAMAMPVAGGSLKAEAEAVTATIDAAWVGQYKGALKAELAEGGSLEWSNQRSLVAEFDISGIAAPVDSAQLIVTTTGVSGEYSNLGYGIYFYDGVLSDRSNESEIRDQLDESLKLDDGSMVAADESPVCSLTVDVSSVIEGGDCLGLHSNGKFSVYFNAPYGGSGRYGHVSNVSISLTYDQDAAAANEAAAQTWRDTYASVLDKALEDVTSEDLSVIEAALAEYEAANSFVQNLLGEAKADLDVKKEKAETPVPASDWTVVGTTAEGQQGGTATVEFSVPSNTLDGVRGAHLVLTYDNAVLSVADENAVTLGSLWENAETDVNVEWETEGAIGISIMGVSTENILSGEGSLLSVAFTVKDDAAEGESPVTLEVEKLLDADMQPMEKSCDITPGKVIVTAATPLPEYTPGDVNNDAVIGLEDALLALQINTGIISAEPGTQPFLSADVDGNGTVSTEDVLKILKKANGKEVAGL